MRIAKNTVVSMSYTLKDPDGNLIDQSQDNAPFYYLHGASNIIPGLENQLAGKQAGDALSVAVSPQDGYGERDDDLVRAVPRNMFDTDQIQPGMQFTAHSEHGHRLVTVVGVDGDNVTLDENHPLAGVTLHFDVKILEVRSASEEEIGHGHVHGPDDHHH